MAKKVIQPKPGKRVPAIVVEDGNIGQEPLAKHGINFVEIGSGRGKQNNLMPTNPELALESGPRSRRNFLSRQFDAMTQNVSRAISYAKDKGTLDSWANWYNDANELSQHLSRKYGITHLAASGVLAATSTSGVEWGVNQDNAERLIQHYQSGRNPLNHKDYSHLTGEQVENATRILAGEHPNDVLGEQKGGTFARQIYDPESHSHLVTADTQMHFLLEGWKRPWQGVGGGAPNYVPTTIAGEKLPLRFLHAGKLISDAASEHGLTPMQGQSVGWMAIKDMTPGVHGTPPPTHSRISEFYNVNELPKRFRPVPKATEEA